MHLYIIYSQLKIKMAIKENDYSQLLDCTCNLVRSSARKITQHYESSLREAGIKPTQFTILAVLANNEPLQMSQLADALLLERTGLTRNLNVLERNGWVSIQTGKEDSRQRVISLTEEGRDKLHDAMPYWQNAQAKIEKQIGSEKLTKLRTTLNQITDAITD